MTKMLSKVLILIDNGHGENTPGKCSPDRRLREYAYTRIIAGQVVAALISKGYNAQQIVTETIDVSLGERCRRVNALCAKYGTSNVLLVSIHVNAAGSGGKWMLAGGWCAYTTRGKTKSDMLAECLYDAATKHLQEYSKMLQVGKNLGKYTEKQVAIRTDKSDGDRDIEADFYIIKHTSCPAVLTENLFQDNKSDVEYLLSEEGKKAVVDIHVEGIINYLNRL